VILRTALLLVITQRIVVISYRRFGTTYRSHLQGPRIQIPKRNNPEERSSHILLGGNLKWHVLFSCYCLLNKGKYLASLPVLELYCIGHVLVFIASTNAVYLAVRNVVCCALFKHTHANKDVNSVHISVYNHMSAFLLFACHSASLWEAYKTNTITTKAEKPNMYLLVEESLCISVSFLIPFRLLLADGG